MEFDRHSFPLTIAAVPEVVETDMRGRSLGRYQPLAGPIVVFLRDGIRRGRLDIVQHGDTHETVRKIGGNTEFAGVPYRDQYDKIQRGRSHLQSTLGISISGFVPPWNTYDIQTVRALEALGFHWISANLSGPADSRASIDFVPATANLLTIEKAVTEARNHPDGLSLIVVMFHDYDFIDKSKDRGLVRFSDFKRALDWLAVQNDVSVSTLTNVSAGLDVNLYFHNRKSWIERFAVPWRANLYQRTVYRSLESSPRPLWQSWIYMIGFYPFWFLCALLVGIILKRLAWGASLGITILAFFTILYFLRDLSQMYYMFSLSIVLAIGLALPIVRHLNSARRAGGA